MNNTRAYTSLSFSLIVFVVMTIILAGCGSSKNTVMIDEIQPEPVEYKEPEVRLSPGDVLEVKFFYTPEINTTQIIRPDGKISLPLIGEVPVQNKTTDDLRNELYDQYSQYVSQIDITIIIQEYSTRRVYVGGEVYFPGVVPMPGKLSVFEALMMAGGVKLESGVYENVLVIRYQEGVWTGVKLNIEQIMEGSKVAPYYLNPLDIVFVPETRIYKTNRWIQLNIAGILPEIGLGWVFPPGGGPPSTSVGVTVNPGYRY
jgi:protein involved in polysaccharide export with SLBB domain